MRKQTKRKPWVNEVLLPVFVLLPCLIIWIYYSKHILYYSLSGLSPFAGDDDAETLNNVSKCDWDFDSDAFKGVSQEAKDFIKKLILKTPQ